jgi:hypothetical protein
MGPEGLGKLIKIIHLIGSRTRNLPVCNIVPLVTSRNVEIVATVLYLEAHPLIVF